jgi:acyl transferase domain-containing protein/acyl carrier protein
MAGTGEANCDNEALRAVDEALRKVKALGRVRREPIAVVGMSCRFPPGGTGLEAFWQTLHGGVDAITEVPPDRWDAKAFFDPDPGAPGKMTSRYGGFLSDVDQFDPTFFGIAPREAVSLDPQHRILLEVSWEALKNAALPPDGLSGSPTGVFIGICSSDYVQLLSARGIEHIDTYSGTGNAHSVAAGRLSYLFGLQGPSLAVDTACSSSLVAVHLACQALRSKECNLALAGGVNLTLAPEMSISLSKLRMLSPDGRCKAFDASANGFVRGEGCGVVVLKRLSDAEADGDNILALIRGSAVNQDGRSTALTAPNGIAQQKVIRKALARAGLKPSQVDYIEAHGTGTALGDPIEMGALGAVFSESRPADRPLVVGSVKTNIGHLEGAAGIAGLIKTVLALDRREIPPSLHFRHPSPHIPWDELPVAIPREPRKWPSGDRERYAGVSSFGFSGTNAHVVLGEASAVERSPCKVEVPNYPFQRERYWVDRPIPASIQTSLPFVSGQAGHPLRGCRLELAGEETVFQSQFDASSPAYLKDHRVFTSAVMPTSGYLEMALSAGVEALERDDVAVEDLCIHRALRLKDDQRGAVQVVLTPSEPGVYGFRIASLDEGPAEEQRSWTLHASGRIAIEDEAVPPAAVDLAALRSQCSVALGVEDFYERCRQRGVDYGPQFRALQQLSYSESQAVGMIQLPVRLAGQLADYRLHPVLLDGCFQVLAAALPESVRDRTWLPSSVERFRVFQPGEPTVWSHVEVRPARSPDQQTLSIDVQLISPTGQLIAAADGLCLEQVDEDSLRRKLPAHLEDCLYRVAWERQDRDAEHGELPPEGQGNWLILADPQGVAAGLAEFLEVRDERCVLVFPAERYEQVEADRYLIRPGSAEDFRRVLEEGCRDGPAAWQGVVHLWSLAGYSPDNPDLEALKSASELGCSSTLRLLHALGHTRHKTALRIWLVTRGGQPVLSQNGRLQLGQAPLWGMGRVIALEHPELRCVRIDLDPAGNDEEIERLFQEVWSPDSEDQVAYRQDARYVARLTRHVPETSNRRPPICPDATYLITGGLGALGLDVARWLVHQGARHLLLTGRSGAGSDAARRAVAELRQANVQIVVMEADVSDPAAVDRLLHTAAETLPPVRGVVHAAGILDDGLLLQQDWDRFARVLAPKLAGAWNLHESTREQSLDFFVSFSSIASLLGSPGQANYAAANAFLDALAHYRRSLGLPGLSINWGPWRSLGMAASLDGRLNQSSAAAGIETIDRKLALQSLGRLLPDRAAQVGVLAVDWSKIRDVKDVPLVANLVVSTSETGTRRLNLVEQLQSASDIDRYTLLAEYAQDQLAQVLGLARDRVDLDLPLNNMGLDSLMAFELKRRVETDLGVNVPMITFLEDVNVGALATMLSEQLLEAQSASSESRGKPAAASRDGPEADADADWIEGEL